MENTAEDYCCLVTGTVQGCLQMYKAYILNLILPRYVICCWGIDGSFI